MGTAIDKKQNVQKNTPQKWAVIKFPAVLVLFILFFITFIKIPVYNYDFWWHLATGKYIVENSSLPQSDPFSFTSHEAPTQRKSLILKGYWLAQVIFFKVHTFWDLKGIIFLRAFLLLLFLFFVFRTIKKQGASDLLALLLVTGVFFVSKGFMGERPQLFTFLLFSVTLYLLEDFRINRSRKIFLIPVLILLLSNMHPGYAVCILLVSLYFAGEGFLSILKNDAAQRRLKALGLVWILTLIGSLFNPNGPAVFHEFSSMGKHTAGVMEFMPTFSLFFGKLAPVDYSYLIFLALSLLSLRYLRQLGLVRMTVLLVFTLMSFIAVRFLIFYMAVSAPILADIFRHLRDEKPFRRLSGTLDRREAFLTLIALVVVVSFIVGEVPALAKNEFKADSSFAVPRGAADFLEDKKISGNMFNEYASGGYLIWRLYSDKKVFIDGRSLEPEVYEEYKVMASASGERGRSWEDILKKHNITYVVMPPLQPVGAMYPIVEKLLEREDWVLIYSDHLSLIFLSDHPENKLLSAKFVKDKKEGFNTIIAQAFGMAMMNKTNPHCLIALGKAFFKTGNIENAEKAFLVASQRDPGNPVIKEWLQKVKEVPR